MMIHDDDVKENRINDDSQFDDIEYEYSFCCEIAFIFYILYLI